MEKKEKIKFMEQISTEFLPVTREEMLSRGWEQADFVYVCGDAYVDHPSFGAAIISRVLEAKGFRVAMLCQPDCSSDRDFLRFGAPRLGFLVSAGNIDSMVAHYTVAKHRRTYDYYSPGGKMGKRPDRAVIAYTKRIRSAFGEEMPVILGGLEASLRRFAHYDYWDDRVRKSVLVDSGADILTYGMGEAILIRLAELLDRGIPIKKIRDVRGTVYLARPGEKIHFETTGGWKYEELCSDKKLYAEAFHEQYRNQDAVNGQAIVEYYGDDTMLVQNPPMPPLEREMLDWVYSLPYVRNYHPMYEKEGGVPAIAEVQFSITHNRGCFGGCNFCALAFHQGRTVRSRSIGSVVEEAKLITKLPGFKGYIHDIGGPTANFRRPACEKQLKYGVCPDRKCLAPTPCKNVRFDHTEYMQLLREVQALPGIKKVFIRSGIRFDYVMGDKETGDAFMKQLVRDHVSGQLKVAPEHCSPAVLRHMGKPDIEVFEAFKKRYFELSRSCGLEQYLVPYLMSSHPGSTLEDAVNLAVYLKKWNYSPEQVQDFYPTPGTASTVMFYTGIDPFTGKDVYVPTDREDKRMQRALLQFKRPENADLVRRALVLCHREDLIGTGPDCLVRPATGNRPASGTSGTKTPSAARAHASASTRTSAQAHNANRKPDTGAVSRTDPSREAPRSRKGWAKPKVNANTKRKKGK